MDIQSLAVVVMTLVGAKAPLAGAKAPLTGAKAPLTGAKAPWIGAKAPSTGAKAPSVGAQAPSTVAPDGRRGFGAETRIHDVLSLFHSSKEEDRAFLAELSNLSTEVDVLAASSLESCRASGQLALLDAKVEPSIEALVARYTELAADPFARLAVGDAGSLALGSMLADTRFRSRARVLAAFELEQRELQNALAVLRAATNGFVLIEQGEGSNIIRRADLAASLLRAMRSDLLALRQAPGARDEELDARALRLVDAASASEGENVRRAGVQRACEDEQKLEDSMCGALITVRLRERVAAALEWRQRLFDESLPLRVEALTWLPDSAEGLKAEDSIRRLHKHERMRGAGFRASQGLAIDPLDDQLAWICAHASDFLYGIQESRPWYDRYLALHRIRSHDQRTYANRKLDPREREALDALQRSPAPPPIR